MAKEPTLGTDQLLPYEKRGTESPASAVESLSSLLESDPEFGDDQPTAIDDSASDGADEATDADVEEEESPTEESAEPDSPEDSEEEPAPPSYRVKVDGNEVEVTLDELLLGYSREADYRRKTSDVANQRKELERTAAEIRATRDQYVERLQLLEQALTENQPPEPDWDKLRKENPAEYAALKLEHEDQKQRLAGARAERDRVRVEQEREFREQLQAHMQAEAVRLVEAVPEWKDEKRAGAEKKALTDYAAQTYGWTPDDLGNVTDHRLVVVLRKAMLYDKLQTEGKQQIREKAKAAPVLQPGGRLQAPKKGPQKERQARMNRLRQTGRAADAASVIESLID